MVTLAIAFFVPPSTLQLCRTSFPGMLLKGMSRQSRVEPRLSHEIETNEWRPLQESKFFQY